MIATGAASGREGATLLPRPIRILSDDLTGALDTAAMLAARGPIPVSLDRPPEADDFDIPI